MLFHRQSKPGATSGLAGITGREGWLAPARIENEENSVYVGLSNNKPAGASRPSRPVIRAGILVSVVIALTIHSAYSQQIVDQILTLVNDEVITRTDLLWSIAMDPKAPSPAGPVSSDLLSQKLDVMIDERLIAQEATRIPTTEITQGEIEKKRTELIKSFKNEAEFRQRIGSVGLTPQKLDELLRERILIDRFADFRFRSFVLVTEQEIKRYYDETFAPGMRAKGQVPSALDQMVEGVTVHDRISAILKQEKINAEIDRWLTSARQRADVVQLAEP